MADPAFESCRSIVVPHQFPFRYDNAANCYTDALEHNQLSQVSDTSIDSMLSFLSGKSMPEGLGVEYGWNFFTNLGAGHAVTSPQDVANVFDMMVDFNPANQWLRVRYLGNPEQQRQLDRLIDRKTENSPEHFAGNQRIYKDAVALIDAAATDVKDAPRQAVENAIKELGGHNSERVTNAIDALPLQQSELLLGVLDSDHRSRALDLTHDRLKEVIQPKAAPPANDNADRGSVDLSALPYAMQGRYSNWIIPHHPKWAELGIPGSARSIGQRLGADDTPNVLGTTNGWTIMDQQLNDALALAKNHVTGGNVSHAVFNFTAAGHLQAPMSSYAWFTRTDPSGQKTSPSDDAIIESDGLHVHTALVATLNGQNGANADIQKIGTGQFLINATRRETVLAAPPDWSVGQSALFPADQMGLLKAIDLGTGVEAAKCRPAASANTAVGGQQPLILAATTKLTYQPVSPLPSSDERMPVVVYVELLNDKDKFVNMNYRAYLGSSIDEAKLRLLAEGTASYAIVRQRTAADGPDAPPYIGIKKDCDKDLLGATSPDYSLKGRSAKKE